MSDNKSKRVQLMFDRISNRYDLMNSMMTWGQDQKWRKFVVGQTELPKAGRLLDIGCGTGSISLEARKRNADSHIIASDFSFEMMKTGRLRSNGESVTWCSADALNLPFKDQVFDAVTSGYLVRNAIDIDQAFREQVRVVKSGGRVVCLETSPPQGIFLKPFINLYFKWIIPLMGQLITGDKSAYTYLPETTQNFLLPDELAKTMQKAGLTNIHYKQFMFGTMAVHTGIRP